MLRPYRLISPSRPDQDVLVLRVSNRQPFPSIAHHELEARDPGSDREKRDRAVRILPRRDLAPEFAEVEHGSPARTADVDVAQGVVVEVPGEPRRLGGVGRDGEELS